MHSELILANSIESSLNSLCLMLIRSVVMARMRGDVDWYLHATQTCSGTVAMRNCLGQSSALHTNGRKVRKEMGSISKYEKIEKELVASNNLVKNIKIES